MLKQITVYAENKKGTMKDITGILASHDINIWGSVTNESSEFGMVRMIVSDPDKAFQALDEADYLCRMTNVIGVEVEDEVGNLNALLTAFLDSNINVDYVYLSFNRDTGKPVLVLHTEDMEEAESCILSKGFSAI